LYKDKYYECLDNSLTFNQFLHNVLHQIKNDLRQYTMRDGFIAFLDGKKINERFKIITSVGKFINSDNINIISAKEVDILSIVYISQKPFLKNNIYVEIIEQNQKDIFLYLEFKENIQDEIKSKLELFFDNIRPIIKQKDWIDE